MSWTTTAVPVLDQSVTPAASLRAGFVRRVVDDPACGELLYRAVCAVLVTAGAAALALAEPTGWTRDVWLAVAAGAAVVSAGRVATLHAHYRREPFGADERPGRPNRLVGAYPPHRRAERVVHVLAQQRPIGLLALTPELRQALCLADGDEVDLAVDAGGQVTLRGMTRIRIPSDQRWFWAEQWQEGERAASAAIAAGDTTVYLSSEEFLAAMAGGETRDG